MKSIAHIGVINSQNAVKVDGKSFSLDTTFVLFFLALEIGRTLAAMSFDLVVMGVALVGIAFLPFILKRDERPEFGTWAAGRAWIGAFGIGLGVLFDRGVGSMLPELLRFFPMSLLIISSILSCQIQFYRFLRLRQMD